ERRHVGVLHRLDQRQRDAHHSCRLTADEHGRVADRLDQPHGVRVHLSGELRQTAGNGPQLLDLDPSAEASEADEIGKADSQVLLALHVPGLKLGLSEHPSAHGLLQVRFERRHEHRRQHRRELLGQSGEPAGHVLLAVARIEEGFGERRRHRGAEARHDLSQNARDLPNRVLTEATVQELLGHLKRLLLLLAEHPLIGLGLRKALEATNSLDQVGREPRPLCDLVQRVGAGEHALYRQQDEAVLQGGVAKLVQGEPVLGERLQQPQTRSPVITLQPIKESCRLEVHYALRRSPGAHLGVAGAPRAVTSSTRQGPVTAIVRTVLAEACAIGGVVPVTLVCGALNTNPVTRMRGLTDESRTWSFHASALAMVWLTATMLERQGSARILPPTWSTAVNRWLW